MKKIRLILVVLAGFLGVACTAFPQQLNEGQRTATYDQIVIDSNGPGDPWLKSVGDINGETAFDFLNFPNISK